MVQLRNGINRWRSHKTNRWESNKEWARWREKRMYRSSALQTCHCVLSRPKVFSPEYETYKKPSSSLSKGEPLVSKCCSALPSHSGPVITRMPCKASGNAQNWTCDRGAHRAVHDKTKVAASTKGPKGPRGEKETMTHLCSS